MLSIAGQTAGLIGLKFIVDTHGCPGMLNAKKIKHFFLKIYFIIFFSGQRRRALQLVIFKNQQLKIHLALLHCLEYSL